MLGKCWVKTACFAISGQSYPTSGVEYFPGRCWVNVGWMLGKNGSILIFGHFGMWQREGSWLNAKILAWRNRNQMGLTTDGSDSTDGSRRDAEALRAARQRKWRVRERGTGATF